MRGVKPYLAGLAILNTVVLLRVVSRETGWPGVQAGHWGHRTDAHSAQMMTNLAVGVGALVT